jgi:hypothetical protein
MGKRRCEPSHSIFGGIGLSAEGGIPKEHNSGNQGGRAIAFVNASTVIAVAPTEKDGNTQQDSK